MMVGIFSHVSLSMSGMIQNGANSFNYWQYFFLSFYLRANITYIVMPITSQLYLAHQTLTANSIFLL